MGEWFVFQLLPDFAENNPFNFPAIFSSCFLLTFLAGSCLWWLVWGCIDLLPSYRCCVLLFMMGMGQSCVLGLVLGLWYWVAWGCIVILSGLPACFVVGGG